jgi:hypothetical protein
LRKYFEFGLFLVVVSLLVWVSGQVNDQSSLSLGLKGEYYVGYIQGLKDGAGRGYIIRDPSYGNACFSRGRPNRQNTYNCYNYTSEVCCNAFTVGIRCGDVLIAFPDSGLSIVCFNTTDRG